MHHVPRRHLQHRQRLGIDPPPRARERESERESESESESESEMTEAVDDDAGNFLLISVHPNSADKLHCLPGARRITRRVSVADRLQLHPGVGGGGRTGVHGLRAWGVQGNLRECDLLQVCCGRIRDCGTPALRTRAQVETSRLGQLGLKQIVATYNGCHT